MALLFADVVAKYNAEKNNADVNTLSNKVADFLDNIDNDTPPVNTDLIDNSCSLTEYSGPTTTLKQILPQSVFMASVASEYYSRAKDDIANTKIGNKTVRKKNFKQVMQESFFYGANRFGTNFIA